MEDYRRLAGWQVTYTHRNGDIEPPTIEGLYWFDGTAESDEKIKRPIQVLTASGETLAWNDAVLSFREIEEFTGLWWGPVMPPWEPGK